MVTRTLVVGAAALLLAGCSAKKSGELMLAVQTDLSLPKDVDAIRIQVENQGVPKYDNEFLRFGKGHGAIRLPGTIAIEAPENPSDPITITVSARSGGSNGTLRVVREVVTTIPTERVATLHLPIQFLCDGKAKLVQGQPQSDCADGETCLAGECKKKKVDSTKLPTYSEDGVFGGGKCFDVAACFGGATVADVDLATCTIADTAEQNLALATEGDGICGPAGCYVALDAKSDLGWTVKDGKIHLPPAVCDKIQSGEVLAVVTATPDGSCAQKDDSLPTCGPWSTSDDSAAPITGAITLAGGQRQPTSIALSSAAVYWVSAGSAGDGAVKGTVPEGGKPVVLADMQTARDLVATDDFVLWSNAGSGAGTGSISQAAGGKVTPLVSQLDVPEGVAVNAKSVFWTQFASGGVYRAALADGSNKTLLATGNYPYRIAADAQFAYWTNEGTAAASPADGSLARIDHTVGGATVEELVPGLVTPRALALDVASGSAKAVYFATFTASGTLYRLDLPPAGAPVELATGLVYPNGIAVDGDTVYWTNRGDDATAGSVMSLPRGVAGNDKAKVVAGDQSGPGAIAADASHVYWINAGSSSAATGAVMKIAKAP